MHYEFPTARDFHPLSIRQLAWLFVRLLPAVLPPLSYCLHLGDRDAPRHGNGEACFKVPPTGRTRVPWVLRHRRAALPLA